MAENLLFRRQNWDFQHPSSPRSEICSCLSVGNCKLVSQPTTPAAAKRHFKSQGGGGWLCGCCHLGGAERGGGEPRAADVDDDDSFVVILRPIDNLRWNDESSTHRNHNDACDLVTLNRHHQRTYLAVNIEIIIMIMLIYTRCLKAESPLVLQRQLNKRVFNSFLKCVLSSNACSAAGKQIDTWASAHYRIHLSPSCAGTTHLNETGCTVMVNKFQSINHFICPKTYYT